MGSQEADSLLDPGDLRRAQPHVVRHRYGRRTESLWFYWPMLGVGIAVAITSVVLLGMGGLFGVGWEQRQIDRYVQQHHPYDRDA